VQPIFHPNPAGRVITSEGTTMKVGRGKATRWKTVGRFYRGGAYERTWELALCGGRAYLVARDGGGHVCGRIDDIASELRYSDSRGGDDPLRRRDHHAFAAAVRRGLESLAAGRPAV
jgi:hypothetical protein